jgi:nickel superoxide dismutase
MKFKLFDEVTAAAHCDVPCGIYDPIPAKIAAKTVERMIRQLADIHPPKDAGDAHAAQEYIQMVSRRIAVKEEHAEQVKHELQILWSDFFKAEHLQKFPHLHDAFWQAMKLASKTKQEGGLESAQKLNDAVDAIAKMFYETKSDPARYDAYKLITDKLFS